MMILAKATIKATTSSASRSFPTNSRRLLKEAAAKPRPFFSIPSPFSSTSSTASPASTSGDDDDDNNDSTPKAIMTKRDIVEEIAEAHDLSYLKSERIVNTVLDTIVEGVADDRIVRLTKFGAFSSYQSAARTGRNPGTGEPIQIPAMKRVRFKPYKSFKDTANGKV